MLLNLLDIKGTLLIKDFLRSAAHYDPRWAQRELDTLSRPGATTTISLAEYARWLTQLLQSKENNVGVYSTLGQHSDYHKCPCRAAGQHRWKPAQCNRLEYALKGETSRELRSKPTIEEIQAIKRRLQEDQWKAVAEELKLQGWLGDSENSVRFPGSVIA